MADESQYPSALADKFMLRLPSNMKEQIKDAAKTAGRSMNSEIIYRLEKAYYVHPKPDGRVDPLPKMEEYNEDLREELDALLKEASDRDLQKTDPGRAIWAGRMALNLIEKQERNLRWIVRACNMYYGKLASYRSAATNPFTNYHIEDSPQYREQETSN